MSYTNARAFQISDAQTASLESKGASSAVDVDLRSRSDTQAVAKSDRQVPREFGTGFEVVDSKTSNARPFPLEDATKLIMSLSWVQQHKEMLGDLAKPIEDALEKMLQDLFKETVEPKKDSEKNEETPDKAPVDKPKKPIDKPKQNVDNAKDSKDGGKDDIDDKDDSKTERIVKVKDSHQLESLKIEKNMVVKLEPGVEYKITKGLKLPEGAKIIGDKNNPPTIDYVGATTNDKGKNTWPACITVDGKDAVVDGVNLECSTMKYGTKGGANGIWANEGADNLVVKNSSAGKIESFIHLNGADNVKIDNCSADKVNSYFLWNEHGSNNTTMKNSRCDDSVTEWTVRAYGDNLKIEDCTIGNKNKPEGPFKGALALYNGSATVEDSVINSGIRIGPLNGPVHGVQFIDPEHPNQLKPDLSPAEKKAAVILNDKVTKIRATGNKITGWITLCQNAEDIRFEDNDIHRPTDAQGEFIACTEYKEEYAGFREPPKGTFVNNRFSGPVDKILHNQRYSKVKLGEGNSLNGHLV